MELSALRRDTAAVEAGEWVDDIPGMGALRLKVRGMSSAAYQAALSRISRAVPREERARDGSLLPEVAIRTMGEAAAETLLIDWEGLTNGGNAQPYDADLAKASLSNPDFRPFLDAVVWAAGVMDNGRAAVAEQLGKNSPAPSRKASAGTAG